MGRCVARSDGFQGYLSSFHKTVREVSGCQTVDALWLQDSATWDSHGDVDEHMSMSSGSLSLDLGDMWR